MTIEDLNKENFITLKLPQYVREYHCFSKFIKLLTNYILSSTTPVDKIINLMNISNATGDILVKLANKLNVYSENADNLEKYYKNLKVGILGQQTKRITDSSLISLQEDLMTVFPEIQKLDIIDNMNMTVTLKITGDLKDVNATIIENYIVPKVTGVKFNVIYIPFGKNVFAFDLDEELKMGDDGNWIQAQDSEGNQVETYVLFKKDDGGNLIPIPDPTSNYYYNGQKVKTGMLGKTGWDKGEWLSYTSIE